MSDQAVQVQAVPDVTSLEQQISEYENQLGDVDDLLELSPDDVTLQTLKSDLLELIKITRQSVEAVTINTTSNEPSSTDNDNKRSNNEIESNGISFVDVLTDAATAAAASATPLDISNNNNNKNNGLESDVRLSKKQKLKSVKEFEIPTHLIPNDGDTEAERNKKRRAIKGLKSKWNEKRKEYVSDQKQHAWQSFVNKKNNNNKSSSKKDNTTSSIFSTHTGGDATKVGVVAPARQMTEFGHRKRHK